MILVLDRELFFKNLDSSLLLLAAFKNQFDSMNLKFAYDILVNTIPSLTNEGVEVLESVFLNTSEHESEDQDQQETENKMRQSLITRLRKTY